MAKPLIYYVDRKAILASLITFLITLGVMTIATTQYNISGVIVVPSDGGLEIIEGLNRVTPTTYQFPTLNMDDPTESVRIRVRNTGSTDIVVSWDKQAPAGLGLTANYDRYSYEENNVPYQTGTQNGFTLPRGQDAQIVFTFEDQGMAGGENPFSITLIGS